MPIADGVLIIAWGLTNLSAPVLADDKFLYTFCECKRFSVLFVCRYNTFFLRVSAALFMSLSSVHLAGTLGSTRYFVDIGVTMVKVAQYGTRLTSLDPAFYDAGTELAT